ncbi:hypothetical protein ACTZWW_06490, partial [Salinarimonas sp. NSM]|uniref:hypothetical protein n=1 Tax=Salinarimonas sp. NSM TaxID=3458003 RepID=UPI004036A676
PVVNVPRPDREPEPQARPRGDTGGAAAEPTPEADAGTDSGTPGERRLRRREGAGGTTGSEVL